jgi:hypothetical protein
MEKYSSDFCYKCINDFEDDDDVVYCPSCGRFYHEQCWVENGGCVGADCECRPEKIKESSARTDVDDDDYSGGSGDCNGIGGFSNDNGAVAGARRPKPEIVLVKTQNISSARAMFYFMFWTAITIFITGIPFFIVGTFVEEYWCFIVASICYSVAAICGFFARLLCLKATCVVVTNKRVIFARPFGKEFVLPLDLITGMVYSSWFGQFGVVSASIRCRVKFHEDAKKYYAEINKALLDRQSNII